MFDNEHGYPEWPSPYEIARQMMAAEDRDIQYREDRDGVNGLEGLIRARVIRTPEEVQEYCRHDPDEAADYWIEQLST